MSDAQPWVTDPDVAGGYRCLRHGTNFTAKNPCGACSADPGPELELGIDALPDAPGGCLSSVDLEADANVVRAQAAEIRGVLFELATDLGKKMTSLAKSKVKSKKFYRELAQLAEARIYAFSEVRKQGDLQLKAIRAAAKLALLREDAVIVAAREKRMQERSRGGSH